jgi:sugar-phosphatase
MTAETTLQCDAVIFDIDGVLVDSTALVERHWREWAAQHGLDFAAIMEVAHGRPAIETMRLVAPHLDAEAEAAKMDGSEAFDTDGLVRVEGAADLVRSVPERSRAVVTSGSQAIARTRLGFAGVPVPDVFITSDIVTRGKPDPESHLLAAERLGVVPEKCVVIEDAPAGIRAARAAGMHVIAVATTHAPEELGEADVVVRRLADVVLLSPERLSDESIRLQIHHA